MEVHFSLLASRSCLNLNSSNLLAVAAGLRCTLANSAYTARELAHQYQDSRAKLVIALDDNLPVVHEMFKEIGVSKAEADKRIVVLSKDLRWAGGPAAAPHPASKGLLRMEYLLGMGKLSKEEEFNGKDAHETVYLCYSSVRDASFYLKWN